MPTLSPDCARLKAPECTVEGAAGGGGGDRTENVGDRCAHSEVGADSCVRTEEGASAWLS